MELIWYHDDRSDVSVVQEVRDATESLAPAERAMRRGEVRDRVQKAAAGELAAYDDDFFQPVWSQPHLWEHKWKDYGYRLYHGEPIRTFAVVLLRFHEKWVGGSASEIRFMQQQEMQIAAERLAYGRSFLWDRRAPD